MRETWKFSRPASALIFFALLSPSLAAEQEAKQLIGAPTVSPEAFFAAAAAAGGRTAILSPLTYWGVRGAAWGTPAADLSRVAPAIAARAAAPAPTVGTGLAAAPALEGRRDAECIVGGLRCDSSAEAGAVGLSKVQYRFGTGVTDRRTRLGMYRTLMNAMQETYGDPSRYVHPQENVRGEDAYVQGLDPIYEAQWSGQETNVALELSDRELAITFTPAARSRAAVRERELNEFRLQVQALPAGNSMKEMLGK